MSRTALLRIASVGLAVTALAVPAGAASAGVPASTGPSGLTIAVDTAQTLSGRYADSANVVSFTARQVTATKVAATVSVNGVHLRATRDLSTGEASWGAGGAALRPDDHAVLLKLNASLAPRLGVEAAKGSGLGGKQDLTARLVMLAAEAPVGLALTDQVVPRPGERRLEKTPSAGVSTVVAASAGSKQESCAADVVATTTAGSGERAAALAACQEGNEDGIWYWSCATKARWIVHDANSHCILWESLSSGPGSSGCLGECGPNCNGLNIYTYDCGDHDRCGRVHGGSLNPWDAECGDEYWEADDDFIWGWPNC